MRDASLSQWSGDSLQAIKKKTKKEVKMLAFRRQSSNNLRDIKGRIINAVGFDNQTG